MFVLAPPDKRHGFSIVRTDIKNEKYIILANSAAEKAEWMEALNECIGRAGFV